MAQVMWGSASPMNSKTKKPFEERLSDIVVRIEKSGWTDEDKNALYAKISEYLHGVIAPVVLKYTPQDELMALSDKADKVSIDEFITLMKKPFSNPRIADDLNATVQAVLDDVEVSLEKGGIS
jgi:hypothetical protein